MFIVTVIMQDNLGGTASLDLSAVVNWPSFLMYVLSVIGSEYIHFNILLDFSLALSHGQ